jgi:glycosyltransferase involved in cell wall biosynthesis
MHDTVSVIIPCYKQAGFLSDAIESVLAQTHPHVEIIVVDDGSPDDTSDVALRYPGVRCIRQRNQGLSAARNTGIRESTGDFLVFLDADDRLIPNALETGLKSFRRNPDAAVVVGKHRVISAEGLPVPTAELLTVEKDHFVELLRGNCKIACPASVMYQRRVFDDIKGFNTSLKAAEDYDLYLRIAQKFAMACHRNVVAEYRHHGDSMSSNQKLMLEQVTSVLRDQLERLGGNTEYEEACRTGLDFFQRLYRIPIILESMRTAARKRDWSGTLRDMLLLLWSDPRVFTETMGRKVRRVISQRLRSSYLAR